jgi:hypothetical protein
MAAANGIGPGAVAAFENRLKHLKRNGFPAGANLGKTGRYDYTASDVIGLAVAVRLMDAYAMPTTAIQLVEAGAKPIAMLALDRLIMRPTTSTAEGDDLNGQAHQGEDFEERQPEPFAPRHYAFFPGVALSSLGSRSPGAGRYDAPVDRAVLLDAERGATVPTASGILLDGAATFDGLIDELNGRGFDRGEFATSLLACVSPTLAEEAERHADTEGLPRIHRNALWHLGMLLRLLDDWRPDAEAEDTGRLIGHHARLLLNQDGPWDLAAMTIDEGSGATVIETVLAILDAFEFPISGLPTGWPVSRHIDMLGRIGAPRGQPDYVRRWLLKEIPRLATTLRGRDR